jgi:hypothetical protein
MAAKIHKVLFSFEKNSHSTVTSDISTLITNTKRELRFTETFYENTGYMKTFDGKYVFVGNVKTLFKIIIF